MTELYVVMYEIWSEEGTGGDAMFYSLDKAKADAFRDKIAEESGDYDWFEDDDMWRFYDSFEVNKLYTVTLPLDEGLND